MPLAQYAHGLARQIGAAILRSCKLIEWVAECADQNPFFKARVQHQDP
jgi:hypothetical protein